MATLSALLEEQSYYIERLGRRQIERLKAQDKGFKQAQAQVIAEAMRDLLGDANRWFLAYSSAEGIDPATAQMRAETADVKYLAERAREYVARRNDYDFAHSETANAEMRLYNLSMQLSRAELILRSFDLTMRALSDNLAEMTGHYILNLSEAELYRQAMILGDITMTPSMIANAAELITRTPQYGRLFSDTVWANIQTARDRLAYGFRKSLLLGENPRTWARYLEGLIDEIGSDIISKAETIAITETAVRQEILARKAAVDAGFTFYQIIAEIDDRTCEVCLHFDHFIGSDKDRRNGDNAPLFHPRCRCRTYPYYWTDETIADEIDRLTEHIARLRALDTIEGLTEERVIFNPEDYLKYYG